MAQEVLDLNKEKLMKMLERARGFADRYAFGLALGVSLAVIIGTAIYVRAPQTSEPPANTENLAANVEGEDVQRLADVTKSPDGLQGIGNDTLYTGVDTVIEPTIEPLPTSKMMSGILSGATYEWPIKGDIGHAYSEEKLVYLKTLEAYGTHTGLDIAGTIGDAVASPMSGTIKSIQSDALWGSVITISHPDGLTTRLCGVLAGEDMVEGATVTAGKTVGTLDASIAYEELEGTHAHIEVLRDGKIIDPGSLLN